MVHCVLFDFFSLLYVQKYIEYYGPQTVVINTRDMKYVIEMWIYQFIIWSY